MADLSKAVKAAILARLDGSAAVAALVPAHRIFPRQVEAKPAYPFIRYEGNTEPYETGCGAGISASPRLHVFADGEAACEDIAAAVVAAMDADGPFQSCDWIRTQFMPDGSEADIWHAIIDFSVIHTV